MACDAWLLSWPEIDTSLRCWDAQAHEYTALLKIVKARRGRYCSPRAQFRAVLRRAIETADADYNALMAEWDTENIEDGAQTQHAMAQYLVIFMKHLEVSEQLYKKSKRCT